MAVAFAAGILITIKNNGWTYRVNLPENSQADIDKKGNVTVTIPGEQESTKTPGATATETQAPQVIFGGIMQVPGPQPGMGGMSGMSQGGGNFGGGMGGRSVDWAEARGDFWGGVGGGENDWRHGRREWRRRGSYGRHASPRGKSGDEHGRHSWVRRRF